MFFRAPSETRSGSESESLRYGDVEYEPPATYRDYHCPNNLAILDMDEDIIKLATARAPSSESATSTPVHARRPATKKKRVKPHDWKTKGAYREVHRDSSPDVNGHSHPEPSNVSTLKPKNGLESNVLKNKTFRIGSAKRVLENTSLQNGENVARLPLPAPLLAGDGDPDFGTPV